MRCVSYDVGGSKWLKGYSQLNDPDSIPGKGNPLIPSLPNISVRKKQMAAIILIQKSESTVKNQLSFSKDS